MKKTFQTTIEIFRTDVTDPVAADICTMVLSHQFPRTGINFDLEDADNILRVEGRDIDPEKIAALLASLDVQCTLFTE